MKKSIFLILTFIAIFVAQGNCIGSGHLAKNILSDQGAMIQLNAQNINSDWIIGAPVPPEIENPELLGINKEAPHATLMVYGNQAEAHKANRHASSFCHSLNGAWKFNYVTSS